MISQEAKAALDSLTDVEKALLKKHTPHIEYRNDLIRKLSEKGFTIKIIQEISGISRSAISRIYQKKTVNVDRQLLSDIRRYLSEINTKLDKLICHFTSKT